MPHESDGLEASPRVGQNQSVSVPASPVKKYPIHSFFSGDYVTVNREGNVSITYVPVLPRTSAFQSNLSSSFMHSPEYVGPCVNVDDNVLTPLPPKTLTRLRDKLDSTCNTKLPQSTSSYQEDMELSPRLTLYMEEGIVPESPVVEVSHLHPEIDGAAHVGFEPKRASPGCVGAHTDLAGCNRGPVDFEKNGQGLSFVTELGVSTGQNVLGHTQAKTEEPTRPSNVKICTPTKRTPTGNLLHDSFSGDCLLRSRGDASGSVQQAPKYRRLCKYGDKVKRVSSISFDGCHNGSEQCDIAARAMSNKIEHGTGELIFFPQTLNSST